MVKTICRKRLKFKDDYVYLNRNMIIDPHPNHVHESLLKTFKAEDLTQYPDLWRPYEVLSEYLGVKQDQLLITRGVEGAFKQLYETFNLDEKTVGVTVPTHTMYYVYSDAYNTNFVPIKGTAPDYKITVEQIKESVPELDVLFLVNPSSHLSNCFTDEELEEIIEFCNTLGVIVFLDEVYVGWEKSSYIPHLDKHDNLIISSGFSKMGFPSIKTGWLVTNKELKKKLESTRNSYEINYFSCKSLEFIIDNLEYFETLKKRLLEVKKRWIEKLSSMGDFEVYDSALYTLRIYSENESLIKRLCDSLYAKKIVVHIEDKVNLTFSVCMNKEIEEDFFKAISECK
jgi:histidinol-phosphate/aromatic aminotransferase/cobyric acid decarboxylase-like protein